MASMVSISLKLTLQPTAYEVRSRTATSHTAKTTGFQKENVPPRKNVQRIKESRKDKESGKDSSATICS